MTLPPHFSSPLSDHINWDTASSYRFEQLNESKFISDLTIQVSKQLALSGFQCELIVFATSDNSRLPDSLYHKTGTPRILFYLSNELSNKTLIQLLSSQYDLVLKTYLRPDCVSANTLHLWPGTLDHNILPEHNIPHYHDRDTDFFFSGALNNQRVSLHRTLNPPFFPFLNLLPPSIYRRIIRSLPGLSLRSPKWLTSYNHYVQFNDQFMSGLSSHEYYSRLLRTKIAICPPGFDSPETFRHLEALQAGAVVISQELPPFHCYRKSPILQIPSWEQLPPLLDVLLRNPAILDRLSLDSRLFWNSNFSLTATVKYVVNSFLSLYRPTHLI